MITKIRKAGATTTVEVTIPHDFLEILGWKLGDRMIWTLVGDGLHLGKFTKKR